ncbi:MAG: hypothetical protein IPH31_02305 [Lewinellaceae bacterium]|nr:hypothetical protein [Lewinellaceae bacterium]
MTFRLLTLAAGIIFQSTLCAQTDTARTIELREATIESEAQKTMGLGRLRAVEGLSARRKKAR